MFEVYCETGLFTIPFQHLGHLCEDLDKFGSERYLVPLYMIILTW